MDIKIAAAQYPITEHASFYKWKIHVEKWISEAIRQQARLLVFPEYGAMELVSLFSQEIRSDIRHQVQELDSLKSDYCQTFSDLAKKYKTTIIAPSIPIIDNNRNVNRAYVFSEKGLVGFQDKFFMTRFENEEWGIQSGEKQLTIFEASWGNFGIQICYDIEFPLGSQQLSAYGALLIVAPSCTETVRGATRVHIGARARALENQIYTAASQTVGNAQWSPAVDINYGFSAFYSTPDRDLPEDGILSTMTPQKEGWLVQSLNFEKIEMVRKEGQVLNYKDQQLLRMGFLEEEIIISRKSV